MTTKRKINLSNENIDYEDLIKENKNLKHELSQLNQDYEKLEQQLNLCKNEIDRIHRSNSWKLTKPYRAIGLCFSRTKRLIKKIIIKIFRFIYIIIPIPRKTKSKIVDKLEHKFTIVRKIRRSEFNHPYEQVEMQTNIIPFGNVLSDLNKKVAIHAHVYYIDLIDEFVDYFNNMPYEFDLFVSVSKDENISIVKDKCSKVKNIKNIVVKKCQNIGRDFSPMFVEFGKELQKYDYICHIHTKKSVRTGSQQDGWRNHLIGSVLGSKELIQNIFYQFENNSHLGLIYPETYVDMPYWAHTYLQNKNTCSELCAKFGIELPGEYIDYSVGSVFWAKKDALSKLFDMNLKYSDFGKEEGKNDGTFAHAIERIIPSCAKSNNYSYLVVDISKKVFKPVGEKNLYQYCLQNYESIKEYALSHDVVSFDIFDTLLTRKVVNPESIKDIIGERILKKYEIKIDNFKKIRNDAELQARKKSNFKNDVNINDIYEEFQTITGLSTTDVEKIKQLEIDTELEFIMPRYEMLKLFNEIKESKKKIVLISDMYLTTNEVTKLLNKCGYYGWDELIISCEINKRKDNGDMWDYYFKKDVNSVHIGDNEQSDIQAVCDRGHDFIHVMQGLKINNNTLYGKFLYNDLKNLNMHESVMFGLIQNKILFNNPFRKDFSYVVHNYHDYGYVFLAPLFLKFFLWLQNITKENKNDGILFLAREGYYLEKLYKEFCNYSKCRPLKCDYFLASRRAVSIAAINNIDDIDELLEKYYDGSLKNFFETRMGYSADVKDTHIELPKDKSYVLKIFEKYQNEYFEHIKKEQNEYKKYALSIINKYKNPVIVDLGYAGTIQYFLSKLLNKKLPGYYFVKETKLLPPKIGCKLESCFDINNKSNYEDELFYNSMILEAFLTAPYGQLVKFEKGKPVYRDDVISKEDNKILDEIFIGITDFIKDIFELCPDINENDISSSIVCKNFYSLIKIDNIISNQIEEHFTLEDKYCSDGITNVFSLLKSRRK